MTGLDLESFLLLLRADLGTWAVMGLTGLGLAILVWLGWGSRRVLRRCLVISLAAHLGMVLYGSTVPAVLWAVNPDHRRIDDQNHIREIRVLPFADQARAVGISTNIARKSGKSASNSATLELVQGPLGLADSVLRVGQNDNIRARPTIPLVLPTFRESAPTSTAMPDRPLPPAEARPLAPLPNSPTVTAANLQPIKPAPIDEPARDPATAPPARDTTNRSPRDFVLRSDRRLRPDRSGPTEATRADQLPPKTESVGGDAGLITGAIPRTASSGTSATELAAVTDRPATRSIAEIPRVYQPRLDPERFTNAQRLGASTDSEQAVDRALDWLARHQDREDGRWNGGIARYDDGSPVKKDHDFSAHCPAGDVCHGECAYWEADTALTGLALLTFLGAGQTHIDGRHAETVAAGLRYLTAAQKRDGDLRGQSRVVGMYCHAMATLALCEAFALTGDERLRAPAERAIAFLARARAKDGLAWRYAPGAPIGDTSILGWVVLCLKSAKEIGVPIPEEGSVRTGALGWLDMISAGDSRGLARYQPSESPNPTMTAEAWVCRQFLGAGVAGPASDEAAAYLLGHESDRGSTNYYYWYYATLALYQHGGPPWTRWNSRIRDRVVSLQKTKGHAAGSWDPDSSIYGSKGGRIYSTTLAALTLEVYYRYLRLYNDPTIPIDDELAGPATPATRAPAEGTTRRINPEDQ
jgi:hypothetical protein